jgi:hypothetical protein
MRFTPRRHPKQNSKNRRHACGKGEAKKPRIQEFKDPTMPKSFEDLPFFLDSRLLGFSAPCEVL